MMTVPKTIEIKKYVKTNLDDYFNSKPIDGHQKCIGCAKCVSPARGGIVEYKYHNLQTNNNRQFGLKKLSALSVGDSLTPVRVSWDYDKIRQKVKVETSKEKLAPPKENFYTTNKLKMTGAFLMPYRMGNAEKAEKMTRPGGDMNCFFGTTTNDMQFNEIGGPMMVRPSNKPLN